MCMVAVSISNELAYYIVSADGAERIRTKEGYLPHNQVHHWYQMTAEIIDPFSFINYNKLMITILT